MLTKVVDTSVGQVEYTESGHGEPILYFHGTGITGDVMIPVEQLLVDDGFRLIVPNRPGYGETPLATHETLLGCSEVAAALLDRLKIDQAFVMGSSGGAAFALAFAVNHPQRTRSMVLLCPQLHRWDHKKWMPAGSRWTLPFLRRRFLRKLLLKGYRFQLARMTVKQFLKTEAGDRFSEISDDPVARDLAELTLSAMAQGVRHPGFENDSVVFTREEVMQPGASLNTPTLVIHDPSDPLAPICHVEWFASLVPDCERLSVHAAGHLVWVGRESPLMHEARVRFLRRADSPRN